MKQLSMHECMSLKRINLNLLVNSHTEFLNTVFANNKYDSAP